jgi:hypothetical protein
VPVSQQLSGAGVVIMKNEGCHNDKPVTFYALGRCTEFSAVFPFLVEVHKLKVQKIGMNIVLSKITLSNHDTVIS